MPSKNLFEPGDVFNVYSIDEPFYARDRSILCFLATDTRTGRQVKLHCVDRRPGEHTPERVERFHATVARLRALGDPALAALYDGGVTDRVYWAATEHAIERITLSSLMGEPEPRLSVSVCLMVVSQLVSALLAARDAGFLHLCLTPDRILMHPSLLGVDKLLDIGLAELFSLTPAIMRSDPLCLLYRAPEQLRDGGRAIDERADIYGLGMILYAMLACNPPFADKEGRLPSRDKLLLLAMTQTPPLLGDRNHLIPEFLDVFVQSMIAKIRANRPPSLEVVRSQLDEIFERYRVWCGTMNELGTLEPRKAQTLLTALWGPGPKGDNSSGEKRSKPRSGEQPSAAVRAGIEGYRSGEDDEDEDDNGTSEPEWLAAMPEERDERDERDAVNLQSTSESPEVAAPAPDAAPDAAPAPLVAADEPARDANPDPPPEAGPAPEASPNDRISPERVTLPSGHLEPLNADVVAHPPTRRLWAAFGVAVLAIGVLVFIVVSAALLRGAAPRPLLARSAGLNANRLRELLAIQREATPRAPKPVSTPAIKGVRREMRQTPVDPPVSTQQGTSEPASAAAEGERDCSTFYCLKNSYGSMRPGGD